MNDPAHKLDTGRSKAGWSSYGCFRKCPRKFAYENRPALPSSSTGPISIGSSGGARALGTFVHNLLALYYLHKAGKGQNPTLLTQPEVSALAATSGMNIEKDAELLADNWSRFLMYANEYVREDWTVLEVEQEHRIGITMEQEPTGGNFLAYKPKGTIKVVDAGTHGSVLYTSRIDLVIRDGEGKVWAIDHKTASRMYPDTILRYGLSGQMQGLWHIGRHHYGVDFAGVLLNFFQTRGPIQFQRRRPAAAPKMVEDFPKLVWNTANEIAMWDRMGETVEDWPTSNNETVCISTYGTCDHSDRCRFGT